MRNGQSQFRAKRRKEFLFAKKDRQKSRGASALWRADFSAK